MGTTAASGRFDSDDEKRFRTAFREGHCLRIKVHTPGQSEPQTLVGAAARRELRAALEETERGEARLTITGAHYTPITDDTDE